MTSDKLASAYALERRTPYLARDLIEFSYRLPAEHEISDPAQGERILRDAAKALGLPREVWASRDKRGFASPVPAWRADRGPTRRDTPLMKMTAIGCGCLGATHAACMAELGHEVLGMDSDIDKVHTLSSGKAPFFERDSDDLLAKHIASGRLKFTASHQEAAEFADLHFIGVGTPQQPGTDAYDLSHLFDAVRRLAAGLARPAVVAVKSTVPV